MTCISRAIAALAIGLYFGSLVAAQTPVSLAAVRDTEQGRTERIEKALAEDTTLEFVDTPFKDVVAFLADQHDITIVISKKIEDAGVERDKPVTRNVKQIKMESALRLLLTDLDLTFMIKDEVLIITTHEDAQSPENMQTRVYPVADLVRIPEGNDFDSIIDLITTTIEPDSWQDVGGPGSANGHEQSASLVISQRRDIHQRVDALLTALRRVRKLQNITPSAATASAPVTSDAPLSRSLPLPRRPSTSGRIAEPAAATRDFRGGGGGLFSVPSR